MRFKTALGAPALLLLIVVTALGGSAPAARADDLVTVKGMLAWETKEKLPAESIAVIQITDPDAVAGTPMLAEQRLPLTRTDDTLPFAIQTDRDGFKDGRHYVLRATILEGTTPTLVANDVEIDPAQESTDLGTLQMLPYRASPSDAAAEDSGDLRLQDLQGIEWVVEDINGEAVLEDSTVTLTFGVDAKLSGKASCNGYHAGYALDGEKLKVAALTATKMACAKELMNQERNFLDILSNAENLYLDEDGALVIESSGGRSITARNE